MNIAENISELRKQLPSNVALVAVSKTKPAEALLEAYHAGQRAFGENYVQELTAKQAELPADIEWHFIGHLQSNKVKYLAPFVEWIHGVDSLRLLQEINKQASRNQRVIQCLLQIHIAREETKFGLDVAEARGLLHHLSEHPLSSVRLRGLMGMATFTDQTSQIREEFRFLKNTFTELCSEFPEVTAHWDTLSMGMSSDWKIAVEEGSTLIRVGSAIFGQR